MLSGGPGGWACTEPVTDAHGRFSDESDSGMGAQISESACDDKIVFVPLPALRFHSREAMLGAPAPSDAATLHCTLFARLPARVHVGHGVPGTIWIVGRDSGNAYNPGITDPGDELKGSWVTKLNKLPTSPSRTFHDTT